MKRFSAVLLSSALLGSLALPAFAAEFMAEDELSVSVPVGGDLYAAGGRTTISESVTGDLVVVSGEVNVQGNVTEDLIAAGGKVRIEGAIGDDVRVAGGEVRIQGTVEGDVLVAGGTVEIAKGTVIKGDLVLLGGDTRLDGEVQGDLTVRSGMFRMSGIVLGESDIKADDSRIGGTLQGPATIVSEKITLESGASFGAPVIYWTEAGEMDFGAAAVQGATYDAELAPPHNVSDTEKAGIGAAILSAVIGYSVLSAALVILIMLLITKTFFPDAAKKLKADPWPSLGIGTLYFICTPIFGLLLLITIIGIPLAVALFAVYAVSLLFANVFSAIVIANWAQMHWQKKWGNVGIFFIALLIFIALKILTLIPVVGWIVKAVLVFMAYGAVLSTKWTKFKKIR